MLDSNSWHGEAFWLQWLTWICHVSSDLLTCNNCTCTKSTCYLWNFLGEELYCHYMNKHTGLSEIKMPWFTRYYFLIALIMCCFFVSSTYPLSSRFLFTAHWLPVFKLSWLALGELCPSLFGFFACLFLRLMQETYFRWYLMPNQVTLIRIALHC